MMALLLLLGSLPPIMAELIVRQFEGSAFLEDEDGVITSVVHVAYILSGNTQIFVSEGISKICLIGEHAPG